MLVKPTCPAHVVREGLLRERGMELATGGTGSGQAEWECGPAGPLGGLEVGARGLEAECGVRCVPAPQCGVRWLPKHRPCCLSHTFSSSTAEQKRV